MVDDYIMTAHGLSSSTIHSYEGRIIGKEDFTIEDVRERMHGKMKAPESEKAAKQPTAIKLSNPL